MYPRPVLVAAATLDFFPIEGTHKTFHEVSTLYSRFGHADRIAMAEGYHGHQYSDENQEAAFEFLDHFNQLPARHALAPAKDLDEKTAQCTRTGQVMLDFEDARSLMDVIHDYYTEHQTRVSESIRQLYLGGKYPGIATWEISQYRGLTPTEGDIAWESAGTSTFETPPSIAMFCVTAAISLCPCCTSTGQRIRVAAGCCGSARTARRPQTTGPKSGSTWTPASISSPSIFAGSARHECPTKRFLKTTLPSPSSILPGLRQSALQRVSGLRLQFVADGQPYFLQMIEDAEIALRFSRLKLHAGEFSVASDDEGFTLANAIAGTLPGVRQFRTRRAIMKWSTLVVEKRELWPIQYLLPGGAYIH